MMKTISLVAWKRPAYLKQVISSLRENDISGYKLFAQLEPGCDEVFQLCNSIDFIETDIRVNEKRLGVNHNTFTLLDRIFKVHNSDFNVYLEEDTILSPDAFDLANWFYELPSRDRYLVLCFYCWNSRTSNADRVVEGKWFNPWGFCFTREKWNALLREVWLLPEQNVASLTWDHGPATALKKIPELYSLIPELSRSRNIGRDEGLNYSADTYDDQNLSSNPYNQEKRKFGYRVTS